MSVIRLLSYNIYSLFFCLRHLPFKLALKIPVLIHPSVKVRIDKKSSIVFPDKVWRSMFSFGFDTTIGRSNCRSMLVLKNGGQLAITGSVIMGKGTRVVVDGGKMKVGHNFFCNGDCYFNCTTSVIIGKDNMYGWNINFNTTDGHHFYVEGTERPIEAEIILGDHVWIGSYCNIGKGTQIADGSVVAQGSLVTKRFSEKNILIGGMPAKKIKDDVSWKA